jgi:hypothetical protein
MVNIHSLQLLSDDDLLRSLSILLSQSRRVEADLVAHIAEVDERRLYASSACSSMFVYAIEVLHLSEHEAYERITAARASRRYPKLLEMLSDGRLHLSGLGKLAPHLTDENCETLLARAAHKTKRQIEELVVELSPKPDVPAVIRKLPAPGKTFVPPPAAQLGPDRVPIGPTPTAPPPKPSSEPLAPSRYKVQFTASGELREKLERLEALMQADLAAVIDAAVTEKLERLEAKRYAETKNPRKNVDEVETAPKSRYIPAPVRRAVIKRDGQRCAFRRPERSSLHRAARTRVPPPRTFRPRRRTRPGDDQSPGRTHNLYAAERDYGKDFMTRFMGPSASIPRTS